MAQPKAESAPIMIWRTQLSEPYTYGFRKVFFKEMNDLAKKYNQEDLSMGMSSDYLDAVRLNSSYLRIGSKIFGKRT